MAQYIGVNGVARNIASSYVGVGGVARANTAGYIGVEGVARQFLAGGTPLSSFAVGSIVYINESGSPVGYYVAKHDYESGLNGAGRTLMVRTSPYTTAQWHSSTVNAYASSSINTWLNGSFKALFSASVQTLIGTTTFYYTPGNGSYSVSTLARSIFLLSCTEYGKDDRYDESEGNDIMNVEGSALSIAQSLYTGSTQWTRSPYKSTSRNRNAFLISRWDYAASNGYVTNSAQIRPAFTLPSTAKVDANNYLVE